ncbi:MAG: tRNA uridine-5-carboxymethylaminomethyl(34) synthesis enzyme MnmG, partial [Proteobacteria bacterium]
MHCDVLVIGGGHAGIEAAHAAARMGLQTILITLNLSRVGFMSCNPAMGGLAKGQLVKEIDALGGLMGRLTDQSGIQFRRLNTSKGPAVRSSRAQCDKRVYALNAQSALAAVAGLTCLEGEVSKLLWNNETGQAVVQGIELADGSRILSRSVIITSGTFMRALMFTGFEQEAGGRAGDQSSNQLSDSIEQLGINLKRLKTGTPPRLHKSSIDYSRLEQQPGDARPIPFSFYQKLEKFPYLDQIHCYITYTNEKTHEIIEQNFNRSPMFTGVIQGLGPRYCPSIEDKVKKFRDKTQHQLYLEPEGHGVDEIYVNGISTSLPK